MISTSNFIVSVSNKSLERLREYNISKRQDNNIDTEVIDTQNPDKVHEYLQKWLESELGEYLYICDPYFSHDDLDVINLVASTKNDCSITILTGNRTDQGVSPDQQFSLKWKSISDAEPPNTEVIFATFASGKPALHDRSWITSRAGLSFGSSVNAIGSPKISHISKLTTNELKKWKSDISPFLNRIRYYEGEKVNYLSFYL